MATGAQLQEISLLIDRADRMPQVAQHNLEDGFFESAINRCYYAVFYSASAMLVTKGIALKRHSGVISAFRQHFVKPGFIEVTHSDVYGRLLDHRTAGDYELLVFLNEAEASQDLKDAQTFVARMKKWLMEENWL